MRIFSGVFFFAGIFIFTCLFIPSAYSSRGSSPPDSWPGPELLYPVTEDINLTSKDILEFKWKIRDVVLTDGFDFRLYKGYETLESTLILKKRFSLSELPIQIPSNDFEINQVYTWVLVQVYNTGKKSDRSHSSFVILRK